MYSLVSIFLTVILKSIIISYRYIVKPFFRYSIKSAMKYHGIKNAEELNNIVIGLYYEWALALRFTVIISNEDFSYMKTYIFKEEFDPTRPVHFLNDDKICGIMRIG